MTDEPTDDERPVFTQEALDAIVQKRLAEELAKLAAGQAREAEKQRRAERRSRRRT